MSDLKFVSSVLEWLEASGVHEYCLASGSRNGSVLYALAGSSARQRLFIDERAAAFFALGRIQATGRPVAVVCTSGTAAAEFLPATIEAWYSGLPLVLLTCDRPRDYRGSGAPQSIEQVGLYSQYTGESFDLCAADTLPTALSFSARKPVHINLCLDEIELPGVPAAPWGSAGKPSADAKAARTKVVKVPTVPAAELSQLRGQLEKMKRPLVVAGGLDRDQAGPVKEFLKALGAPIYAEAFSHLREDPELDELQVLSGERALGLGNFDGVVRVGSVPTTRFWRDLEGRSKHLPVVHLSPQGFRGLRRGSVVNALDKATLAQLAPARPLERDACYFELDRERWRRVQKLLEQYPLSEPALIHALSKALPEGAPVYLGNSLPIREWDLFANRQSRGYQMFASRGANGIDGQVSTFLGLADQDWDTGCFGILGDMTCLYDPGAFWIDRQLSSSARYDLFVMNNQGGRIFGRVASLKGAPPEFMNRYLYQEHDFDFSKLAMLWNLEFASWQGIPDTVECEGRRLVELRPDARQSEAFWKAYARLYEAVS